MTELFTYPSALWAGGVLLYCFGRVGGRVARSRLWGIHISETVVRIYSIGSYNKTCWRHANVWIKSPWSLFGTSTHPTIVTQRSQSLSWMIDSHRFCSMSVSPPIPEIRLFQTLTLKLRGQCNGCGQRAQSHTVGPVYTWFAFFLFHINQRTIPEIQLFQNLTLQNSRSRSWVWSKVKVMYLT